jgi:hypothetical protein
MRIIEDPGMAVRAGNLAMDRLLEFTFRDKQRDRVPTGVFFR